MNIVITGENGYIANQLYQNLSLRPAVNSKLVSVREDLPEFNIGDICIHMAALVHKKESTYSEQDYYKVNTELTGKLALKAKEQGVRHFIFMSTMAVFGVTEGVIDENVVCAPKTLYGKSKYAAEEILLALEDASFKVTIVRPPMVYGPNCPGNYALLSKFSHKLSLFPAIQNKRSMLYVGNLIEMIIHLIEYEDIGIFHPQDSSLICTSEMVEQIRLAQGKPMKLNKFAGKLVKVVFGKTVIYQKIFRDLYYTDKFAGYRNNVYQKYSVEEAIVYCEKGSNTYETSS